MSATILAIETSVTEASVALLHQGNLCERSFTSKRQQNQLLFAPLKELLDRLEGTLIDTILVGTGPGSYSGSRIAIATAQGIAALHQSKLAGICSFFAVPDALHQPLTAVGDARRGSYFSYTLNLTDSSPTPQLHSETEFIQHLDSLDSELVTFEATNPLPVGNVKLVTPTATNLIKYWSQLDTESQYILSSKPVEPLYLRAPFITKSTKSHPLLGK